MKGKTSTQSLIAKEGKHELHRMRHKVITTTASCHRTRREADGWKN
jgi:hypothetical protein